LRDPPTRTYINTLTEPEASKSDSFTGKYVPAFAHTIHQNNPTAELKINLHGKETLARFRT